MANECTIRKEDKITADLEAKIDKKIDEFDRRLKSINERVWFILISILGGFGTLLLALLAVIVPLINHLLTKL